MALKIAKLRNVLFAMTQIDTKKAPRFAWSGCVKVLCKCSMVFYRINNKAPNCLTRSGLLRVLVYPPGIP